MPRAIAPTKQPPPAATTSLWSPLSGGGVRVLQRKCACGSSPGPSGECEECRKKELQRKPGNSELGTRSETEAPPIVHEVLRAPGQSLDPQTRAFMEPRFGHDFSQVRVHSDGQAAESAQAVNARAYTVGRDIVFGGGQYDPRSEPGRNLLAHELTHTIQQSAFASAGGPPAGSITIAPAASALERAAEQSGNGLTGNPAAPAALPGVTLQRAPAADQRWARDVAAARYRGQIMAKRIKTHGLLSKDARAKMNQELAYFEAAAKEAYLREVRPILRSVAEIEMPAMRMEKRLPSPHPMELMSGPAYPGTLRDEQLDAPSIEAKQKEAEELAQVREGMMEHLRQKTKGWGPDQEFALGLLKPILQANTYPDPRGVAAAIRQAILDRYRDWLMAENNRRQKLCGTMPGGVHGFILKQQAAWHPTMDPCRSWFKDEYSHGPQELRQLERLLRIRGTGDNATETVYWSMHECRMVTDPYQLQQTQMAGEMLSGVTGLARVPGKPAAVPSTARASVAPTEKSPAPGVVSGTPAPRGRPLDPTQPGIAFEKTEPGAPSPYLPPTGGSHPPSGGGGGAGGGGPSPGGTLHSSPPPMPRRPPPPRPVISWFPRRSATPMGPGEVQQVLAIDHTRVIWSFNRGNNMSEWTVAGGKGLPPLAYTSGSKVRVDYYRWRALGLPEPSVPTP